MSKDLEHAESGPGTPSIVISHANQDADLAGSIADALNEESLTCWLASRDIPVGSNFAEEISRAISGADFLLVLLSPQSISSPHVKREVNMAIDKGVTLLPVLLGHHSEFMGTLPDDWNYWLSLAQFVTFTDVTTTVSQIAKQVRKRIGVRLLSQTIPSSTMENKFSLPETNQKLTESAEPHPKIDVPKRVSLKPKESKKSATVKMAPTVVITRSNPLKPNVKVYAIVSATLAAVLIAGIAFAVTNNSSPKSSLSDGPINTLVLPSHWPSPSISHAPTHTAKSSNTPRPSTSAKPVASAKVSAKPSGTTASKAGSSTSKRISINQTLISKLSAAATVTLKECVSRDDPAPTGCPFHEKIWVHGLYFIWSLRGTPHVTSVVQSGTAFVGTVTFSVVDRITYERADSKIRTSPQTITARAYFRPKGSKYTVTWK